MKTWMNIIVTHIYDNININLMTKFMLCNKYKFYASHLDFCLIWSFLFVYTSIYPVQSPLNLGANVKHSPPGILFVVCHST